MLGAETVKDFQHLPVLLRETLEDFSLLSRVDGAKFLDGTLGLGGHSRALLEAHPGLELLGLDRDAEALGIARERLAPFGGRVHTVHCRFSQFAQALDQTGWERVDGALIDIGVSSLQLDEDARGFSLRGDAPLDMRMDKDSAGPTARDIVNGWDMGALRDLVASCGEDPMAGRIARAVCEARARAPIETTGQLAEIVSRAYPAGWRAKARRHPATRTFQALRMAVNDELGELSRFLDAILSRLNIGGRLAVLTFHSLEDRMVKQRMRQWAEGCLCPKYAKACTCGHVPEVKVLHKKPLAAQPDELARNPRASSAKLRCAEKIAERVDRRAERKEAGL
ncbi:MAG: 16S rRNA (cytosine(1402)-N(4))-methyltransferase RsmH [Desulfovibrio sp.]|nr:16S rRNA (cytosine(1402)-N(4))-methyltransferase RsmH [Desulfovibrio sp.]